MARGVQTIYFAPTVFIAAAVFAVFAVVLAHRINAATQDKVTAIVADLSSIGFADNLSAIVDGRQVAIKGVVPTASEKKLLVDEFRSAITADDLAGGRIRLDASALRIAEDGARPDGDSSVEITGFTAEEPRSPGSEQLLLDPPGQEPIAPAVTQSAASNQPNVLATPAEDRVEESIPDPIAIAKECTRKIRQAPGRREIVFELNTATLNPAAARYLQNLASTVRDCGPALLEISGHTDNTGRAAFNLALSENRARAVEAFLLAEGIGDVVTVARGFGSSRPIASNRSRAGRIRNRRIDITVEPLDVSE